MRVLDIPRGEKKTHGCFWLLRILKTWLSGKSHLPCMQKNLPQVTLCPQSGDFSRILIVKNNERFVYVPFIIWWQILKTEEFLVDQSHCLLCGSLICLRIVESLSQMMNCEQCSLTNLFLPSNVNWTFTQCSSMLLINALPSSTACFPGGFLLTTTWLLSKRRGAVHGRFGLVWELICERSEVVIGNQNYWMIDYCQINHCSCLLW